MRLSGASPETSTRMSPQKPTKVRLSQVKGIPSSFPTYISASQNVKSFTEYTRGEGTIKQVNHTFLERHKPIPSSPRKPPTASPTTKADRKGKDANPKSQTMSTILLQFVENLDTVARHVVASETHPSTCDPCACGQGHRTTRCKDCFGHEPTCDSCFLKDHDRNPLHFIEKWNGRYFEKMSQAAIGRVICLGHGGLPCPSAVDVPLNLDVVSLNGVHGCRIRYCECTQSSKHWEQLLQADLFPATISKPATAFSFAVLKEFDLLSSVSKSSAMDFVTTLRRMTSNGFSADVPDFYKSFRRTMRLWRTIQIKKRAGVFHGMRNGTDDADDFCLCVKCPACPQPGFNMPQSFRVQPSNKDKHKFTLFISIDGNFKQQLKIKNCDPDDIELFIAFFSKREYLEAYLKLTKGDVEKSTCANLKANNLQSQLKFISMVVSGVVSCKCARHDMFMPGATVDLKKGESFAYTDFALKQALTGFENYTEIVCSYDIACQYSKKIQTRFRTHFPAFEKTVSNIRFHVPKLHGHGHNEDCRYLFSFDYARNVGRTHGERIESGWAEGNLAGPSTREMNAGHRHETLSYYYNEWNFQQTVKLAEFLARKLVEARWQSRVKSAHFKKLTVAMGVVRTRVWKRLDPEPIVRDGEVSSVYRVKDVKVPTMDTIEARLEEATNNVQAASALNKPAKFVATGMKLEERQFALKGKLKRDDADYQRVVEEIGVERLKLRAEIDIWRKDQALYMPDVLKIVAESPNAEDERLFLPSHIPLNQRDGAWYESLGRFETELRKGQADDALSGLRLALKYKDSLRKERKQIAYGNRNRTRALVLIGRVEDLVDRRAATYRRAREALITLGMPQDDPSYPVLAKEDVALKVVFVAKELGSGKYTGSWIWEEGPRGVLSDAEEDEWEEEGNKVEWFRARLDAQQWREEKEILEEELKRTSLWFGKMSDLWQESAISHQKKEIGFSEYAYHKADMFARRASEAKEWFQWASKEDLVEYGKKVRNRR